MSAGDLYFEASYPWIEQIVRGHGDGLRQAQIQSVVGILRGGTVPAFIAAQSLDCPLHFVRYDRDSGTAHWQTTGNLPPQKILLVDDIAGEGETLSKSKAFLEGEGHEVITLTLCYDRRSRITPEFSFDLGNRIVIFPWERHRLDPRFASDLKTGRFKKDSEYQSIGIDLDGLLVPDIPEGDYARDLALTLRVRDDLKPFARDLLPPFDPRHTFIVTGRPWEDKARTQAWLDRHGMGNLRLQMRDDTKYPHSEAARYKAETARALGIVLFYESDIWQANLMTEFCPLLDVVCWNNDRGIRLRVGAARSITLPQPNQNA